MCVWLDFFMIFFGFLPDIFSDFIQWRWRWLWLVCVWSPSPLAYTERHCIRNASQIHQTATCTNKYFLFIPTNVHILWFKKSYSFFNLSLILTSYVFCQCGCYKAWFAAVFVCSCTCIWPHICIYICLCLSSLDFMIFQLSAPSVWASPTCQPTPPKVNFESAEKSFEKVKYLYEKAKNLMNAQKVNFELANK